MNHSPVLTAPETHSPGKSAVAPIGATGSPPPGLSLARPMAHGPSATHPAPIGVSPRQVHAATGSSHLAAQRSEPAETARASGVRTPPAGRSSPIGVARICSAGCSARVDCEVSGLVRLAVSPRGGDDAFSGVIHALAIRERTGHPADLDVAPPSRSHVRIDDETTIGS